MRRVGMLVIGASGAVFGLATPALAAPTPTPGAAAADQVCSINDSRLIELSGLVTLSDGGYVVENDSNSVAAAMRVFYLDSKCKVIRAVSYPTANPARDPEDLAVASDGTVWVADIGDNLTAAAKDRRETVALWKMPAGGGTPVIYRLAYPDGPHDAEALLFGAGDVPVIVTKDPSGTATIYQPTGPLQPNTQRGVPLTKVGSWKPKHTGTSNFLGPAGQILVTGAAQSPDRKRFVLRTYSDAYEWDAPDGDVVKAMTREPRVTALPDEPQGEGIAYSTDGKSFLTCSDQTGVTRILRYRPTSGGAPAATATGQPVKKADTRSWVGKLTLPQIVNIVAAVGVLGLVLVVVGVIGIRQSRKSRRQAARTARDKPPIDVPPSDRQPPVAMSTAPAEPPRRNGGTTYGGGTAQPGRGVGNVYGGGREPGIGYQEYSRGGRRPTEDH